MTTVLTVDRHDDLRSNHLASFTLHMPPSGHSLEHHPSDATAAAAAAKPSSSAAAKASVANDSEVKDLHEATAGRRMTTMRDRYRFHEDEGGVPHHQALSRTSPGQQANADWRYSSTAAQGGLPSSSAAETTGAGVGVGVGAKRQRSPSRPRSQQGSQAAQIASVKEMERENIASAGRFVRTDTAAADDDAQAGDTSSPRKTPRLEREGGQSSSGDWPRRRRLSHISESEPTSASASSSRIRVSHSRNSSADETATLQDALQKNHHDDAGTLSTQQQQQQHEEKESNYTWHQRERGLRNRGLDGSEYGALASASPPKSDSVRLPPFYRPSAPSSAPPSAVQAHQALEPDEGRRSISPPPRLPGFATLSPYQPQHGGRAPAGERRASPSQLTSPTRHYPPPMQPSHLGGAAQPSATTAAAAAGHQRMSSYGMPGYGATSPRPGHGPSSMSAHSPSLSQASHTTPGQAFIHPSLAGLPGAGGGAGSKQQPSFVSKLYSMLEDDTIEDMIAWGPTGTTFSVANPAEFAKIVLPNWFKHSNWQSFVRQLNMYGFHKVNHTYQGTPEEEIQVWEFKHPSFRRGEVHLLSEIKRKSSRHKRQDSLTRSLNHAPEYDMGGTPSPEMGISSMGGDGSLMHGSHMHGQMYGSMQHPAAHHGQGVPSSHPYGRSAAGQHAGPGYGDYAGEQVIHHASGAVSHQHARRLSGAAGGPSAGGGGMHRAEHDIRHAGPAPPPPPPPPLAREPMMSAGEGSAAVRMDDLSDRIDAIIRHASYLEGQLRTVSEQLFHAQQNEASLRTHVHHLESQMRSLSDQVYQSRHIGSAGPQQGGPGSAPPQSLHAPPPPPSPSSSSLSRLRSVHGSGGGTSPPPSAPAHLRSEQGGRFVGQTAGGPHSAGGHVSSSGGPYPSRSPIVTHPSYATRSAATSTSGGMPGSGRATPASSADAYTRLGPPPPPSGSGVRGGLKEDHLA